MRRRIKKANIKFISLVPKGANRLASVYKDDGSVEMGTLMKFDDEKGELLAVVYAPDVRDSQGDIADTEVVKQMAYDFISNSGSIDIRHDGKAVTKEQARVAETFLVQKSDERFHGWKTTDGQDVDLTGAWATVLKIDDPDLRAKYRSGEWAGVSMGGTAVVEQEKASVDELVEKLSKALNPPTNPNPTETMDETKILKTITDGFEALGEKLVTALKPAPIETKKEDEAPKKQAFKAPLFKGDYSDDRALELHMRKVQIAKLQHEVDWSDAESILTFKTASAALRAEWAHEDEDAGIDVEAEKEELAAKKKPARSTKGNVAKEGIDQDILAGVSMATDINKARGFPVGKED